MVFFLFAPIQTKEKTEYHVQYFIMELISVHGLACLFNVYFFCVLQLFDIIIVTVLTDCILKHRFWSEPYSGFC